MSAQRSKFDVPADDECPTCRGQGVTHATAPDVRNNETLQQGSGCPDCLGVGRIHEASAPGAQP